MVVALFIRTVQRAAIEHFIETFNVPPLKHNCTKEDTNVLQQKCKTKPEKENHKI